MTQELIITKTDHPISGPESGGAEIWTLNRPDVRNALNPSLVSSLSAALQAAEGSGVQAIVLRGNGLSFCAGADLNYLQTHESTEGVTPREFLSEIWDLTIAMENSPMVFVAALHGHAVAGGLELALACDVVIAEEGTLIGDGHVGRKLVAGGGASARLERSLGRSTAFWLALTGTLLKAEDPSLSSWLRTTTPKGALDEGINNVLGPLLSVPASAQQVYKQVLNSQVPQPTLAHRDRELDAFDRHWVQQNVSASLREFLNKNRKAS